MSDNTELIATARKAAVVLDEQTYWSYAEAVRGIADALESSTGQLAAAWDEGFDSGYDRVLVEKATASVATDYRHNPYRAEGANRG